MTAPAPLLPIGPQAAELSFQVVLVQPDGYTHAAAFSEVIESVACGLRSLGADVSQAVNRLFLPGPQPILFGANLLAPNEASMVPSDAIVYNLEQISEGSSWCSPAYLDLLVRCRVWDYSARNIASLRRLTGNCRISHVPIGYVPQLTRIPKRPHEDIDVLFYGSMNGRRAAVIEQLKRSGLKVHAAFGVYGPARDDLISRSKVVLNLHYYDTSIFELVRVSYLLANRRAVVAECHDGTEIDPDIVDAVCLARYEDLGAKCAMLVADDQARDELAQRGFSKMAARDERDFLAQATGLSTRAT